eukprot:CAMPEP_0115181222 /NCGR_PEP_ID=MMETSP0270-20121206/7320_1 /TAXON_ID=71861 /ORGANISM="Scrippsiella trochoidea, Strain CCMP3099" /LENGTH=40 /DNA_ID= /DNA_START= /DNA_END= /DNA_ORIENTATION=
MSSGMRDHHWHLAHHQEGRLDAIDSPVDLLPHHASSAGKG